MQEGAHISHLNVYKALAQLRTDPVFRHGRYDSVALNSDVFAFVRFVIFIFGNLNNFLTFKVNAY